MKMKEYIKYAIGLVVLVLIGGCASYAKVIKSDSVSRIPDKKFEKIIRLDTPEGMPIQPDAGFVYVEPDGKVTTDFPREVFVNNLDKLAEFEQINRNRMGQFIIKDSKGNVRGYYEILSEYRTVIWERENDILLQVVIPGGMPGNIGGAAGIGGIGPIPGGGGK